MELTLYWLGYLVPPILETLLFRYAAVWLVLVIRRRETSPTNLNRKRLLFVLIIAPIYIMVLVMGVPVFVAGLACFGAGLGHELSMRPTREGEKVETGI